MQKNLLEQKQNSQYIPLTLIKLLSLKRSKQKNIFSNASLENIQIERKNGAITYYGQLTNDARIAGAIYPNGTGEEIVIICDRLVNYNTGVKRKHKVKKYRTILNQNRLDGD